MSELDKKKYFFTKIDEICHFLKEGNKAYSERNSLKPSQNELDFRQNKIEIYLLSLTENPQLLRQELLHMLDILPETETTQGDIRKLAQEVADSDDVKALIVAVISLLQIVNLEELPTSIRLDRIESDPVFWFNYLTAGTSGVDRLASTFGDSEDLESN